MNAPGCYVVHPGHRTPPEPARTRLRAWLTANGVDPDRVPLTEPVIVLTVPAARHPHTTDSADGWSLQIIWFTEHYINPDGLREPNLLANEVVAFPRTVPLVAPYPTTEGARPDGEADRETAQAPAEDLVRPAREAEISHRHQGQGQERAGQGRAERTEVHPEDDPRQGHQAVPGPQEGQRRPVTTQVRRPSAAAVHYTTAAAWALLFIPTVVWWSTSILWLAVINLSANIASHLSAAKSARAEEEAR